MSKKWKNIIVVITISTLLLAGCSSGNQSTNQSSSSQTSSNTTSKGTKLLSTSSIAVDTTFSAKDLEVGYEESTATQVTFDGTKITTNGSGATVKEDTLTIKEEGTYILSGDLKDGQIVVDADEKAKIQIVLKGVTVNCTDSAPIYIKNADKVFITLAEGTQNTLTDASNYIQSDDNNVDGVIFSKADLTINGKGTLTITGNYKHGIAVKDKLVITSGTYNIKAVKDAINGNDSIKIKDGTFTINAATGNGISCKNSEDNTKGYVYIAGGAINITKCVEGIEGTAIIVEGGKINLTSSDDGFNAANGATSANNNDTSSNNRKGGGMGAFENDTNCYVSISGGTIHVDAFGDGLDSNGSLLISGGTIYVSGPTESNNGALDYNGTAEVTGGTLVIAGSTGMAQGFSDSSTQYSFIDNLTSSIKGGTKITLKDSNGKVVASFTPSKEYQSIVISSPDLVKDGKYTLTCGSQSSEITLSSAVTSVGEKQAGPGGQDGGFGGPGGRQEQGKPGMDAKTDTSSTTTTTNQ